MLVKTSSMFLERGKKDENWPSISTRTRLFVGAQHKKPCCSGCNESASQFKQGRGPKLHRFPRNDVTTAVLGLKGLRTERRFLILSRGVDDKGPTLNRNDVVELLSDAVETLLKPENQRRLRERLETRKQRISLQRSKLLEQPSNVDQWHSPAPINCLEDLEGRHLEMDGVTNGSGRCSSDQMTSSVTIPIPIPIPITSQTTELVESEEQPRSVEALESPTESVEGKGGSSLTSIRRLKVLDVHSYVHNALRKSALRSWLNSRTIEE